MSGTFALPEVSFFDKMLPTALKNRIVDFVARDLGHLEMLVMITPSMLLCIITWQGTCDLECYCLERVAGQFGYDQDITPSLLIIKSD